jgi:peptide/nickel transport system ATP-binding protein/oligopeptide transport system ATP-binding protein
MSIMRLLASPPAHIDSGRVLFENRDLLGLDDAAIRAVRGDRIGMIFQEPMTSLNPTLSVGFQIAEVLRLHRQLTPGEAREKSIEILGQVGVGAAKRRMEQFPHELSGGLRQRVMIAMALVCHPALLIADEPTTALDVTIQAQILDLLRQLQADLGMAILMITHDLGVVGELCDDVVVMYAGQVVERAKTPSLIENPRHPYTRGLLAARPRRRNRGRALPTILGTVPAPGKHGSGCRFEPRCARALPQCQNTNPPLEVRADGRDLACWNPVN